MPTNMENTTAPSLLVLEKGAENLAGKRRLTDDFTEAAELADEIDGQVYELEPIEAAPFAPVAAIQHVRSVDPITGTPWSQSAPSLVPEPVSSQAGLASIRRMTITAPDLGGDAA